MNEVQTKTINGVNYQVFPFTGAEPFKLSATLLKWIGPAVVRSVVGGMATGTILDADISGLFAALPGFLEGLDETTYWALIQRLLRGTVAIVTDSEGKQQAIHFAEGKEDNFTAVFQGRTLDIYAVILFILQVNYPDFFQQIQKRIGGLLQTTGTSSGPKKATEKN